MPQQHDDEECACETPIVLDPEKMWCLKHRYRVIGTKMVDTTHALFERFMYHPVIIREAGFNEDTGSMADISKLPELMTKHGPICCYLGDATVEEVINSNGGPNHAMFN